jgi:outer membrane protein
MRITACSLFLLLSSMPVAWSADQPAGPSATSKLSLRKAIEIALSPVGNSNVKLAQENVVQAKARSAEARSALLPDIEGKMVEQNVVRSLGALGANAIKLGVLADLVKIPNDVGPFETTDIRVSGTQAVFDVASLLRWQAARSEVRASKAERENANDQISTIVAKAYMAALSADEHVSAAKADVELAVALRKQAQRQKDAGEGTGIEITRADVQLANDEQRVLEAQNAQRKTHLQLLRAIGLPLDADVELTDRLSYMPVEPVTVDRAKAMALENRFDFKAQIEFEQSARKSSSSATSQRLPSIYAFGNYGTTGQTDYSLRPTRTVGVAMKIPVFDGGRTDARRSEAASQYREAQIRTADLRQQVELELRIALDGLHSAEAQMRVADGAFALANSELDQARRRYAAGVSNSIEVTDAQTRLERARDNRISVLLNYNLARLDLGQAMGTIRSMVQ